MRDESSGGRFPFVNMWFNGEKRFQRLFDQRISDPDVSNFRRQVH